MNDKCRIRISENRRSLDFSSPDGFLLELPDGSTRTLGARVRCRLLTSRPARGEYWYKTALRNAAGELDPFREALEKHRMPHRTISFGNAASWNGGSVRTVSRKLLLAAPHGTPGDAQAWEKLQDCFTGNRHPDFTSPDAELFVPRSPARGSFLLEDGEFQERLNGPVRFHPRDPEAGITVRDVRIGIGFHWDHHEELTYSGSLGLFFTHAGKLGLYNEVDLEEYLVSVNSSEMTADSPPELLKAQTIAARATFYATRGGHHWGEPYDLCSDDHCQCYQGRTRTGKASRMAATATAGQVLVFGAEIVDARYSKSCGGIVEAYENVWENRPHPSLIAFPDGDDTVPFPAHEETAARRLIDGDFAAHCRTDPHRLPAGLASAHGYYRWQVEYTAEELAELVNKRLGTGFTRVLQLLPLQRGASGRIMHLEITAPEGSVRVRGELRIRRVLSPTHLYSSLFYVEKTAAGFRFHGAGWGHGVGMCQLGATNLALNGKSHGEILAFYYPGSRIVKLETPEPTQ